MDARAASGYGTIVPEDGAEGPAQRQHSTAAISLKKNDGEPLLREDIQYDFLQALFSDQNVVFSDQSHLHPNSGKPPQKVTFSTLYINALLQSTKLSRVLKEKMINHERFALEFAKIAMLVNVGRINTTMAFFPDMKTALRTYHHIPSLQKTGGNVQDAPRIKAALKGAYTPAELKETRANTPARIEEFWSAGQRPPCSITALIFVLANHSTNIATRHFDPEDPFDLLDFFRPFTQRTAASRAQCFLWLIYHYLEDPLGPNPFDDDFSRANIGRLPLLHPVADPSACDVDTPEELEQGDIMRQLRRRFLSDLIKDEEKDKRLQTLTAFSSADGSRGGTPSSSAVISARGRRAPRASREASGSKDHPRVRGGAVRGASTAPVNYYAGVRQDPATGAFVSAPPPERTSLQHAWHTSFERDVLTVSDEEEDIHCRIDYERRLGILTRLRGGRPPSPEGAWDMDTTEHMHIARVPAS